MSQSTNSPSSTQSHGYDIDPETGAVRIPLRSRKYPGRFALVDPEDVPTVSQHRWWVLNSGNTVYAYTQIDRKTTFMHRLILGITDSWMVADHVNHDGLDNRRCNLRAADQSQNSRNRLSRDGTTSKYKGVSWDKQRFAWAAYIHQHDVGLRKGHGRKIRLGYFDSEREAAEVYDGAALMLFGSYASLNFPDESGVE